jgi:hypothetical protein
VVPPLEISAEAPNRLTHRQRRRAKVADRDDDLLSGHPPRRRPALVGFVAGIVQVVQVITWLILTISSAIWGDPR